MIDKNIFIQYQVCRNYIPFTKTFNEFKKQISFITSVYSISIDFWKGLNREWRAFHYLKKNPKFGHSWMISEIEDDLKGIDIISYDINKMQKFTFQVTGFSNQVSTADYIVKVDKKIYIFKNKKEDKNE